MQFEEVRICNLFSYAGEQVFDLRAPEPRRNIVLISGRNGYGKTSFINSVKLLFSGITESMLRGVQRGRKLNTKQYVVGTGEEWLGIMNRKAYAAGERDCWVEIRWHEDTGNVTARRTWNLENGSFRPSLEIVDSFGSTVPEGSEQGFLEEQLPNDYIPFFLFDGEQIQAIAEANWSDQTQQMERILNISPVETLRDYLSKVTGEWRRNDMDPSAKVKLAELEREKAALMAREAANIQEQEEVQDEIAELERRIEEEDRYLESMRAYSYYRDGEALKFELVRLRNDLEEIQNALAESLPTDIPLVCCIDLLERAVSEFRELVDSQSGMQVRLLEGFISGLPVDLFEKPPYPNPPLTESQKKFYKNRLTKLLQAYIPDPEHITDSIIRIEVNRARLLLPSLETYVQSAAQRYQYMRDLRHISQRKRDIRDIERRLDDVSNLSGKERETYQQRKTVNDEHRSRVGGHRERLKELLNKARDIRKEINLKEQDIKEQGKKVILSAKQ